MNQSKAKSIAVALFAAYPSLNKFYVTTDGQAFENESQAISHSIFLDKKNPEVFETDRSDADVKEESKKGAAPVVVISEEQKTVDARKGVVETLKKQLSKAAANKKPAIQVQLDTAIAQLKEAEKSLPPVVE